MKYLPFILLLAALFLVGFVAALDTPVAVENPNEVKQIEPLTADEEALYNKFLAKKLHDKVAAKIEKKNRNRPASQHQDLANLVTPVQLSEEETTLYGKFLAHKQHLKNLEKIAKMERKEKKKLGLQ